ncbi:putative aquaporin NIP5-1 [Ranunculus cassubicifolius]
MANMEDGTAGTPEVSAPGTPTPGAPLFTSIRVDSSSYDRKPPVLGNKCLPISKWTHPNFLSQLPTPRDVSLTRKMGAEFVGTFVLIFTAVAGPIVNEKYNGVETLIGNALCSGLAVMVVVFSIGHISAAHLNPAVTIAFAALHHFPWSQVPGYILAQVSASICASFTLKGVFHPFLSGGVTVPHVSTGQAFALEFIITFQLMFVITAVATDTRAVGDLAAVAIGGVVFDCASMNPVRTLGPAIAAHNYDTIWIYFVAPTLGAILGAAVYNIIKLKIINVEDPSS